MSANSKQVGGDHYKFTEGMQPWDLFGPEFLMGNAMKYIVRWRKKNGIADLEKAKHYAEKLIEVVKARKGPLVLNEFRGNRTGMLVETCGKNWGLDWVERTIIHELLFFESSMNIEIAIDGIDYLIANAKPKVKTDGKLIVDLPLTPEARELLQTTVSPPDRSKGCAAAKPIEENDRRVPRYFKPDSHEVLMKPPVDADLRPTGGDKNESLEFNWPEAFWPKVERGEESEK